MGPSDVQRILTGKEPTAEHVKFYSSRKFGYSDKAFDKDRFLSVAMLTLAKTLRTPEPSRVVLLLPPSHSKWVEQQFDDISLVGFKMINKYPGTPAGRTSLAKLFGSAFKIVFYCPRVLQLPEKPEACTSFGFSLDEPLPDWLKDGLLT